MSYEIEKGTIRTAYFTDHRTGKTAIAVEVEASHMSGMYSQTKAESSTYGELWLQTIYKILNNVVLECFEGNVDIVLVASQKECNVMARKIVKLWIKLLEKKVFTRKKIESIVAAANHYHNNPTDAYYVSILETLVQCKQEFAHFSIDAQWNSSPATERVFQMAKAMVGPDIKVQPIKKRPKKAKIQSPKQ